MKLFFLFAERRDRASNVANISYQGIEGYTGVARSKIKAASTSLEQLMLEIAHLDNLKVGTDIMPLLLLT